MLHSPNFSGYAARYNELFENVVTQSNPNQNRLTMYTISEPKRTQYRLLRSMKASKLVQRHVCPSTWPTILSAHIFLIRYSVLKKQTQNHNALLDST